MQSTVIRILLGLFLTVSFLYAQRPDASVLRTMLLDKNPEIRVKAAEGSGRVGGLLLSFDRAAQITTLLCGLPSLKHWDSLGDDLL